MVDGDRRAERFCYRQLTPRSVPIGHLSGFWRVCQLMLSGGLEAGIKGFLGVSRGIFFATDVLMSGA